MSSHVVLAFILLATGCAPLTWSRTEAVDWYENQCRPDAGPYCRPMWYAGSDATHHYFVVHVLDTWRSFRVPVPELTLQDVRLFQGYHRGTLYYAVQPGAGFEKLEGARPPF